MKRHIVPLLALLALLCNCSNCPAPDSLQARVENALAAAGHGWADSKLGATAAGPPPPAAGGPEDCRCNPALCAPDEEPATLMSHPPAGAGATPYAGDDPCVACVRANCCAETVACASEYACTCLMAKDDPGITWPASAPPCGAKDATFTSLTACLSAHQCTDVCSKIDGGT
jgi:hypothetical protein